MSALLGWPIAMQAQDETGAQITGSSEAVSPPEDAGQAPFRVDKVVVTATRTAIDPFDAPNAVNEVTAEDFVESGFRTLPEMLRETPGVMVQKTAYGQGSPYVRGFTGFRNLLLIDGVRLNNSVFRDGPNQYWNTVDPYSLARTEIVRGQGSVLFGSDAIGGTVNAITRGSSFMDREEGRWFGAGDALYRYSTAEDSHVGRIAAELGSGGRYGLRLGGTVKEYGDLRAGSGTGTQKRTGYDEWDIDARLDVAVSDRITLTLLHQQVHQDDAWRTHRTVYGVPWRGTEGGDEQKRALDQDRTLTYLQLAGNDLGGAIDAFRFNLSYQTQEEFQDRIRRRGDNRRDETGFDVGTVGTWLQLESEIPWGRLLYGASYYHDEVDSFGRRYNADGSFDRNDVQGPVGDDSSYDLFGAFAQLVAPLGERVDLYVGGRFTYAQADVGRAEDPVTGRPISFSDDWTNATGSARIVWRPDAEDRFRIFGGVSQGFRAPNLSDLSRLDTARSNEIETPAPGLDPEKFVTFEIGGRAEVGPFSGQLAYFYTDMDDLIVRQPTGRMLDGDAEVTKTNAAEGYVHGLEAEIDVQLPAGFSLFAVGTLLDGEADEYPTSENRSQSAPLTRLMPPTAVTGLRWDSASGRLWVEVLGRFADKADKLSSGDKRDTQRVPPGGTPGYAVGDIRAGWRITDNFTILAALENFTDEDYRIHGSGTNEAGRNFIVTGKISL